MAARSRLRFAARLLAMSGLVVGLGVPASAPASGDPAARNDAGKIAKTTVRKACPRRTVCLYPRKKLPRRATPLLLPGVSEGQEAGGRPGRHSTTRRGVSSFENNGVPFARLWLKWVSPVDYDSLEIKTNSRGNIVDDFYDDMAVSLDVTC